MGGMKPEPVVAPPVELPPEILEICHKVAALFMKFSACENCPPMTEREYWGEEYNYRLGTGENVHRGMINKQHDSMNGMTKE